MESRLTIRLVALAVAAGALGYIVHLHGEIARLRSALEGGSRSTAATRPAEKPRAATGADGKAAQETASPRTLTSEQRKAMLDKLTGDTSGSSNPIWFATAPNNPEAAAFQQTIQKVFEEAGWKVRGNVPVRFSMKAGVYIFSADEEPPGYVETVHNALDAAGITIAGSGRGYRDFYRQKKEQDPTWIGFEMPDDQTYIVAIGRKPEEQPAP